MELKMREGDDVPDGAGGMTRLSGAEEVLSRVLFRLTARRGALPFLPQLGSQLHLVLREKPSARQALCTQYVVQALEEETELKVKSVELKEEGRQLELTAALDWQGEPLTVTVGLDNKA